MKQYNNQWSILLLIILGVLVPFDSVAAGNQKPLLRLVVISDLNHSYGTIGYDARVKAAIQRIIKIKPDLVICTGDMIAGQRLRPKFKRQKLEAMWQAFHQTVTEPFKKAGIPFVPAAGNHDGSASAGFSLERQIYKEQWQAKKPIIPLLKGGNYPMNFAFKVKDILFSVLDVTVVGHLPEAQKNWLSRLLDREGKTSKARIAFGHLPMWPLAVGRERGIIGDSKLEKLFIQKSLTAYLSGHQHAYYPFVHKGQYYVAQAALGSGPRRLIGTKKRSPRSFTLIDILENGQLTVNAFTGKDYKKLIKRTSLPPKISYKGTTLIRDDLVK